MKCNLLLHTGSHVVDREVLEQVYTPEPTRTWQPIPHTDLLERVEESLPRFGLKVVQEAHALTHDGGRYFGLIQVQNGRSDADYGWVLGLRNSHDQSIPAGVVAGTEVTVCDNLSFLGTVKVCRKHTRFILRDLPALIGTALGKLVAKWHDQDRRVDAYKNFRVTDRVAHDIVVRSLDAGAITATQIPDVLHEWREPRHEAFSPRNLWSLFNAATEHMKGNLNLLPRRTEALYRVCNTYAGVN